MKWTRWVLMIMLFCFLLGACAPIERAEEKYDDGSGKLVSLDEIMATHKLSPYENITEDQQIQLKLERDTWPTSADSIFAIVSNIGDASISRDNEMFIEFYYQEQWYRIRKKSKISNLETYSLGAGEEVALIELLESYYFPFPSGKYRACFEYGTLGESMAVAEFEMVEIDETADFGDISVQSLRAGQARKDGCVVIKNGKYQNLNLITEFFAMSIVRIPSKIRIVDVDESMVIDISFELGAEIAADKYIVETWDGEMLEQSFYRFVHLVQENDKEKLVFSNYLDPHEIQSGEYVQEWDVNVLLVEPKRNREWKNLSEEVQSKLLYQELYPWEMCVFGNNGKSAFLLNKEAGMPLSLKNTKDKIQYCPKGAEGEELLDVFPVGDQDAGALFLDEVGRYRVARYSGATGDIVEELEGASDDIIQKLQEQAITREPLYENIYGDLVTKDKLVQRLLPADWSDVPVNDQIQLTVEYDVWPTDCLAIYGKVYNGSNEEIDHGDIRVEYYDNGTWYRIPMESQNIIGGGIYTYPGVTHPMVEYLELYRFPFPPGKYRLVFTYWFYVYSDKYVAFAEFEMQERPEKVEQPVDFVRYVQSGIDSQMNLETADGKKLHIDYEAIDGYVNYDRFVVTAEKNGKQETKYFGSLERMEVDGRQQIVLSNYGNLQELIEEENIQLRDEDYMVLFDAEEIGQEAWDVMMEGYSIREYYMRNRWARMRLFDGRGKNVLCIQNRLSGNTFIVSGQENIYLERREGEGYPVYGFRIGEQDFGIVYQREDGSVYGSWYDGETGQIIATETGEVERILKKLKH